MGNKTDYSTIYEKYSNALLANNILTLFGAAVGIIGNFIIIMFYHFRIKDKAERYFIPVLAAVDFVATFINAYGNTVLNTYMFHFTGEFHCRVIWFLELFISGFSGHMVLIIALQRYLLICKPFGPRMTLFWKRIALLVTFVVTLVYSSPSLGMSGIKSNNQVFRSKNTTVQMCVFVVDYTDTAITYGVLLLFLTVTNVIACVSLYLPIVKVIRTSFSSTTTCPTIIPFCGEREDASTETESNENQRIWLTDILKEMQTDGDDGGIGIYCTDITGLDENDPGMISKRNSHVSKNGKLSDGATVSVHNSAVKSTRSEERSNVFDDCIVSDTEIQSTSVIDVDEKHIPAVANSGKMYKYSDLWITTCVKDSGILREALHGNTTDGNPIDARDINVGDSGVLSPVVSTGRLSSTLQENKIKLKVKLFRSSSKLERMKTTMNVMFLSILSLYILSYIPSLVILILRYSKTNFNYLDFTEAEYFIWFFFSRFVFINHIVNPMIYGYFDVKLKTEVAKFFRCCSR